MILKILFAILSVISCGLIAYGVLRKKKKEITGLPGIQRWNRKWIPITLVVGEEEFLKEEVPKLLNAVRAGCKFWNEQIGIKLFMPLGDIGTGRVIPVKRHDPLTMKTEDSTVAYAHLTISNSGELKDAVVYMSNWENLPSLSLARALQHELGHCLGLGHDESGLSVMYGSVSRSIYCVSPADKAFLLEVYG